MVKKLEYPELTDFEKLLMDSFNEVHKSILRHRVARDESIWSKGFK